MLTEVHTEVRVLRILPVSFIDILDAENADEILRAYAEECLVPGATPQRSIYEAMEKAGALQCFAAYTEATDLLIGFVSVLTAVMPHTGQPLATIESLFVDLPCRGTGAGLALLAAAEQYAQDFGCDKLVVTARVGSALDKVLSRRDGYTLTHLQHTRQLGGRA